MSVFHAMDNVLSVENRESFSILYEETGVGGQAALFNAENYALYAVRVLDRDTESLGQRINIARNHMCEGLMLSCCHS